MKAQAPKLYRHFKGKPYRLLGSAKHSETLGEMVIYETLYDNPSGKIWVRPKEMFFEQIERDGQVKARFNPVEIEIRSCNTVGDFEISVAQTLLEKAFGRFDEGEFNSILDNRKNFYFLSALVDDRPIGFKLGYKHDSFMFYSWLGAVLPEYRRVGVASALMKAQHDWCRSQGYKKIQTKTKNKWREMIILNLKFGFQIIGAYTDEKGEPKLILEVEL